MNYATITKMLTGLAIMITGAANANAACRVSSNAQVSAAPAGYGSNVFGSSYPIQVSGSPSTLTADSGSSETCSNPSYSTQLYLNGRYLGGGSTVYLNTQAYPDGAYLLQANLSDGYSSAVSQRVIYIRNNWVRGEVYDVGYYLYAQPDVANYVRNDAFLATLHWLNYGINEGRQAQRDFSVKQYIANYGDLQNAFGTNYSAAVDHYIANGMREGRNGIPAGSQPTQSAGLFQIGGTVFYSNGSSALCHVANPDDLTLMGGRSDYYNIVRRTSLPYGQRDDGTCAVPQPAGFFKALGAIAYSNGRDAFCVFNSWERFVRANGGSTDTSQIPSRNSEPSMRNDGVCQ